MIRSASLFGPKVTFGRLLTQLPPPRSSSNTSTFLCKTESELLSNLVLIELLILNFSLMIQRVKTLISAKEEELCKVALKSLLDFKMSGRRSKSDSQFSTQNSMLTTKCSWLLITEISKRKVNLRWKDPKDLTIGLKKNTVKAFNLSRPPYG